MDTLDDAEENRLSIAPRIALIFISAGAISLVIGGVVLTLGADATFWSAVESFILPLAITTIVSSLLLAGANTLFHRTNLQWQLFRDGGRSLTAWTAVAVSLMSMLLVGLVFWGAEGTGIGLIAFFYSGYAFLVLLFGMLFGGSPKTASDPRN